MRFNRSALFARLAFAAVALALVTGLSPAQQAHAPQPTRNALDLAPVKPESVGFSSERLDRLHLLMQQAVNDQQVAGVVTILARHGKVVDYRAYGMRDIETKTPMTTDTIFRDYSMTKPITGVAMMILYEEGKWLPSDPISKYIPEFAHLKVYAGTGADGKIDPRRPRPSAHHGRTHDAHRRLHLRHIRRYARR